MLFSLPLFSPAAVVFSLSRDQGELHSAAAAGQLAQTSNWWLSNLLFLPPSLALSYSHISLEFLHNDTTNVLQIKSAGLLLRGSSELLSSLNALQKYLNSVYLQTFGSQPKNVICPEPSCFTSYCTDARAKKKEKKQIKNKN